MPGAAAACAFDSKARTPVSSASRSRSRSTRSLLADADPGLPGLPAPGLPGLAAAARAPITSTEGLDELQLYGELPLELLALLAPDPSPSLAVGTSVGLALGASDGCNVEHAAPMP